MTSKGSAERQNVKLLSKLATTACLRKSVIHMMVKMQFGVGTYSQNSDAVSACNRGFTQSAIETKQVGFSSEGSSSGCVDVGLHEVKMHQHKLYLTDVTNCHEGTLFH